MGDGVADEDGRSNKPGHDFGGYLAVYTVEEDVVTVALAVEVVKEVVGASLQVVGQAIKVPEAGKLEVEFNEADQRLVGNGEFNTAVAADDNAFEAGRGNVGSIVNMTEADNLHMGVTNGATRARTVVFKEQNRGEFATGDHIQPFLGTEADNPVEMVLGIE